MPSGPITIAFRPLVWPSLTPHWRPQRRPTPSCPFSGSRTRRDCDFFQPTIPFPGTPNLRRHPFLKQLQSSFRTQALSSSLSANPPTLPPFPIARRAISTSTTLWLTLAQATTRASIANGFALVLRSVGIRLAVLFALIFSRFLETRHPRALPRPSSPLPVAVAVAFIVAVAIVLWCTTTRLLILFTTISASPDHYRNHDPVHIFYLADPTRLLPLLYISKKNSLGNELHTPLPNPRFGILSASDRLKEHRA
ncbi:hypothetical protein B0H65DRAFT_123265 [Neurospora tetraspora]|uniref:Uncharacterized protein n=1 Tax=Neurospora tetraspora TaxID=94610 RepID=A0AAE0MUG0_9PEZI|nr:hypothetical protein B0H65DRAFT_123265 [Neurospora tetraspora]